MVTEAINAGNGTQVSPQESQHMADNPNSPTLTREGYFTVPPVALLRQLTDGELAAVERFVLGRKDIGEVLFISPVDLRGLDLDSLIDIEKGKIVVYPEPSPAKPPPGKGLNMPALLTFRRMHVKQRGDATAVAKFKQRLIDHAAKIGAVFVHYEVETGIWNIKIDSF